MFLDLELLEKQSLHLNWLAQSRVSLINGPKCEKKNPGGGGGGGGGYSQCFLLRRLDPLSSVYPQRISGISGIGYPKK